eukprot:m.7726 g.7726  ORF g.7726 m.7726 type:complete len:166 (-) comp6790_c0_seq1:140-637(-)
MLLVLFLSLCLMGALSAPLTLTSSSDDDNCIFKLPSGGAYVNISTVVNPVNDFCVTDGHGMFYYFNFCKGTKDYGDQAGFSCQAGETAVCAYDPAYPGYYFSVGLIDSVTYDLLTAVFTATYWNELGLPVAQVTFMCGPTLDPVFQLVSYQPGTLQLAAATSIAC